MKMYLIFFTIVVLVQQIHSKNQTDCYHCKLPGHPTNAKWIDEMSGITLEVGVCVEKDAFVTALCNETFSYFGKKKFVAKCNEHLQWVQSGYCTEVSHGCYEEGQDCVVPDPIENSKWILEDTGNVVASGTYTRLNTTIRSVCNSNYVFLYDGREHVTTCSLGQWTDYNFECIKDDFSYCNWRSKIDCKLPDHPTDARWVDTTTQKLKPRTCVRPETTINAVCNANSSFFGMKNWTAVCTIWNNNNWSLWIYDGACSYSDYHGFQANRDCVAPEAAPSLKWFLKGTKNEILPGTYLKENTSIEATCKKDNLDLLIYRNRSTTCKSGRWTPYRTACVPRDMRPYQINFSNNLIRMCTYRGDCVLKEHPVNGKWIDKETGTELTLPACAKPNEVTASCDADKNYFGLKTFTADCYFRQRLYSCTDKDPEGYEINKDCIAPEADANTIKWISASNEEFEAGSYVKEKNQIRPLCFHNITQDYEFSTCVKGMWTRIRKQCQSISKMIFYFKQNFRKEPAHLTWPTANKSLYSVFYEMRSARVCNFDAYVKSACFLVLENIYVEEHTPHCVVPEQPQNGRWVASDSKVTLISGKFMDFSANISLACNKNHKNFAIVTAANCFNKFWPYLNRLGSCEAVCPPLISSEKYKVSCICKHKISENCTEPLTETIAEITCKPIYQNSQIWESRSKFRICLNGKWNNDLFPNCIPKTICGLKAPTLQPQIVNGLDASTGGYPWHAAIYRRRRVICGGSLISDRVIITAAHCVTNSDGLLLSANYYEVAVGKRFSNYNDPRDKSSQSSTIEKIYIPETYKGSVKNFVGDIAMLVAKERFKLHDMVLPVCVNFGNVKLEDELLTKEQTIGHVPGFGVTQNGSVSETLKEISVPYIKHENCSKYLPEEFVEYYSYDKFCAGHLNRSMSVCTGDSGGGLVVQNPQDNRFYLAGIVSVSPQDTVGPLFCNIENYALYTRLYDYIDFILDEGGEYLKLNVKANPDIESPAVRECRKYLEIYPKSPFAETLNDLSRIAGRFPFYAIIGTKKNNKTRWSCNGNLISDRFVLTAGGCTSIKKSSQVIVRFDVNVLFAKDNVSKEYQVEDVYVSPDYHAPQIYNDIALLKLRRNVKFTRLIYPTCLTTDGSSVPAKFTVMASLWAGKLLAVSALQSLDVEECERYFLSSNDILPEGFLKDVQFCVNATIAPSLNISSTRVTANLCQIFPGSSLAFTKKDSLSNKTYFSLAGISPALTGCKRTFDLAPFTKISVLVPWIESVVWPSNELQLG